MYGKRAVYSAASAVEAGPSSVSAFSLCSQTERTAAAQRKQREINVFFGWPNGGRRAVSLIRSPPALHSASPILSSAPHPTSQHGYSSVAHTYARSLSISFRCLHSALIRPNSAAISERAARSISPLPCARGEYPTHVDYSGPLSE
uniref:Uncharacterized protein n=1 Tax=Plectus sambesii TaxID=2011161 RepID=A0A914XQ26_9BILA